ncbi:hypothetical protein Z968_06360 [Clostridium novyi A str. 4552]|uniref:Uncharacterized protein n=1 Tax=Clostridium novyi A str. 4552 TaxID=1444289 RepID=A0A0A0I7Z9_CLONO|nr:oligosaccharide flippase family protein [Clostridium novyi]KGM96426.1 hypothetical protein Z968_06360 [Clostridium novyi A str. 4552]
MLNRLLGILKKDNLVKSGIWYTIGSFFAQGITFISMPIFVNLMSREEYGMTSLYGTWLSIFSILISLDIFSSVGKGKYDFKDDYDDYLSSAIWLSFLCFIIFLIIGVILRVHIAKLTQLTPILIIILILQSFFASIINFVTSKYTINYEYKKYVAICITSALANLLLSVILILRLNKDKYMGIIYAGLCVNVVFGSILFFSIVRKSYVKVNKKYWKYALLISIPLIPHSLSGVILAQFDRVMISRILGKGQNGVYSFAYNIASILNVAWAALNKAWIPYFFGKMDTKDYEDIRKKYKYYIGVFSLITFILMFISPEVVKIFSFRSKGFREGMNIVPIILASNFFIFLYSLPSNLEFYMKKTYLISLGTFGAGFMNIILNSILITKMGYAGAAWATLISYIALFLYHYVIASKIIENKIFEIKYFISSSVFIAIVGVIFNLLQDSIIKRYTLVLIVMLFLTYKVAKFIKLKIND